MCGVLRRRYIASREQRMRSFRESGHRHSAPESCARAKGENYPSRVSLVRDDYERSMINSTFFFFFAQLFFFRSSDFSSSPFLSPSLFIRAGKLLVGIAFQCVNFFTPTFISFFLCLEVSTPRYLAAIIDSLYDSYAVNPFAIHPSRK